jgi:hypothetical protein
MISYARENFQVRNFEANFTLFVPADNFIELKEAVAEDLQRTRRFKPDIDKILIRQRSVAALIP